MIAEDKLAEIRERLPLSELIGEYVQLKKSGKSHRGLCPFHQERTPSFYVSDERESFHCFGCGVGGDLFEFIKKMESLSFPDAVFRLAERTGVVVEKIPGQDPAKQAQQKRAYEIMRQAAWYYHCLLKKLPQEHEVWQYLQSRQLSSDSVEDFFLGYCPPQNSGLAQYLQKKGFSAQELEKSELFRGKREFFRGRLLFPIFRQDQKVVGFGGRRLSEKDYGPKYMNSPESALFKKGELFYGLHRAKPALRQNRQALIVEGYLDVITLHAHGITQALAPLGTALTPHQARTLKRVVDEITLLFDNDPAGEKATLRALEILLEQGMMPKRVFLESGEDPDSYLNRYGRLAFEKKLKNRRNLLEELIDKWSAQATHSGASLEQKGQTARRLMGWIDKIPEPITKNLYRRQLCEALEIPEEWLLELPRESVNPRPKSEASPRPHPSWLPEEETIIEIWLKFPELRAKIIEKLRVEDFYTETAQQLAKAFWKVAEESEKPTTGKYFDLAPAELLEVLRELAIRSNDLEEQAKAEKYLDQAILRLREKCLRKELWELRPNATPEQIILIQQKIDALSKVLKSKERTYDQG